MGLLRSAQGRLWIPSVFIIMGEVTMASCLFCSGDGKSVIYLSGSDPMRLGSSFHFDKVSDELRGVRGGLVVLQGPID